MSKEAADINEQKNVSSGRQNGLFEELENLWSTVTSLLWQEQTYGVTLTTLDFVNKWNLIYLGPVLIGDPQ